MLLYVTVPGFYAEVERRAHPALAERPVIVGGNPRKRGLVQAATQDALDAGVAVGMPVIEALERCPRARALRTDMRAYREVASRLRALFRQETDRVEPAGLEAAYLDVSGLGEPPEEVAGRLRQRIREELGLPARVGIAPVKFLAKLSAEQSGKAGVLRVSHSEVSGFLEPLPVERLPGVGPKTLARLHAVRVRCVGDLLTLGRARLEEELGNHGLAILAYAEGRDAAVVRAAPHPRSLSQELTLPEPELDRAVLHERLGELAGRLEAGLSLERLVAKRVVLKIRYADQELTTRSRTLIHPAASARELLELASELLERTQAGTRPIRLVGLQVAALVRSRRDDRQLDLFSVED